MAEAERHSEKRGDVFAGLRVHSAYQEAPEIISRGSRRPLTPSLAVLYVKSRFYKILFSSLPLSLLLQFRISDGYFIIIILLSTWSLFLFFLYLKHCYHCNSLVDVNANKLMRRFS